MIKTFIVAIGSARAEDRQPSHDGEYLRVYYKAGDQSAWLAEDNAGQVCSHLYTYLDAFSDANSSDEDMEYARSLDGEIEEGVKLQTGEVATTCGYAISDALVEWGWIKPEQFESGYLLQD